jgi:serpin B
MRVPVLAAALIAFVTWAPAPRAAADDASAPVIDANNRFALELYPRLARGHDRNVFFSPYNIWSALALLYEGARGQTADEMRQMFHPPDDPALRHQAVAALHQRLQAEGAYTLKAANAIWADNSYPFLPAYIALARRAYDARVTNVDFVRRAEEARKAINAWVAEQTNRKIEELFAPGALTEDTRMALTTAIYFKGHWVAEFDKDVTRTEDFRAPSGTKRVPMMMQAGERFRYAEDGGTQVIELPYKGEALSMLILLPKEDRLDRVESSLTVERLAGWRRRLSLQPVDVYLPRFTFRTGYDLVEHLKALGMKAAFTDRADFTGLAATRKLAVDDAVHQAFVEVNEEGTEAAAATGFAVGVTSVQPSPPVFRADHPFIFAIQETRTGNLLFVGRFASPVS